MEGASLLSPEWCKHEGQLPWSVFPLVLGLGRVSWTWQGGAALNDGRATGRGHRVSGLLLLFLFLALIEGFPRGVKACVSGTGGAGTGDRNEPKTWTVAGMGSILSPWASASPSGQGTGRLFGVEVLKPMRATPGCVGSRGQ